MLSHMAVSAQPQINVADQLDSLAASLTKAAKDLRADPKSSPGAHEELVELLRRTSGIVNQPRDDLADLMMGFVQCTAIRLLVKWKVFEHIPGEGTISYADLAAKAACDKNFITRLCWVLVSTGMLRQEGADQVAHTARSRCYASVNPLRAMMLMGFDEYLPSFVSMPRYFDTHGTGEPASKLNTIKAFAEGEPGLSVTEIMYRHPDRVANMTLAMSAMENMYPLTGTYDYGWVASYAAADANAQVPLNDLRPLIVDVGGANGHTLRAIVRDTPGLPLGRCVLEDLPEVIDVVKKEKEDDAEGWSGLQIIGMDFHVAQPVKGALAYLIRRCLHDFDDGECVKILQHLSDAMEPDSRLLIGETVLSNPPTRASTMVDLLLSTIGGKERTVEGFGELVRQVGLKVSSVSLAPHGDFAMIECQKV